MKKTDIAGAIKTIMCEWKKIFISSLGKTLPEKSSWEEIFEGGPEFLIVNSYQRITDSFTVSENEWAEFMENINFPVLSKLYDKSCMSLKVHGYSEKGIISVSSGDINKGNVKIDKGVYFLKNPLLPVICVEGIEALDRVGEFILFDPLWNNILIIKSVKSLADEAKFVEVIKSTKDVLASMKKNSN